ncbi:hypothetical protein E2C01_040403 [Portunus trituberculatus]|uniref:Uncharacterized protein n=1 Tax=Portunus trituberculatus TaxID=210409 RepID=A0A5B7FP42_PORTR|nr:hypothetical protein [Portunus trituberculatus]
MNCILRLDLVWCGMNEGKAVLHRLQYRMERNKEGVTGSLIDVNPFHTGAHFYLEIGVRLDHFIDIRKGPWRSED